jgi:hypothetical protein
MIFARTAAVAAAHYAPIWTLIPSGSRNATAFLSASGPRSVRAGLARFVFGNLYSANIAARTARTAADCGPVNLPTRFTSRARSTARI